MLHKSPLQYILLLLILFTASAATTYIGMTVTTSSTQINLASTYNFNINRQYDPVNFAYRPSVTAVPSNTVIIITLPSQFITISDGSTLSCLNSANAQPLTCNVNTAAKTITIPDYYSTSTTLGNTVVAITINNLINAYKAGESDNFYWQIVAPNGTYLGEGPSVTNTVFKTSIIFTPGVFSGK